MKIVKKMIVLIPMLLGLPLAGVFLTGHDLLPYLEFPPKTRFVTHASFSSAAFLLMGLFVLLFIAPFVIQGFIRRPQREGADAKRNFPFPWWGYIGIAAGIVSWCLAWTRFKWAALIQMHTFTPLWISYIVFINALTFQRSGACLMIQNPLGFIALFPVSALFWWFFEYLNRFVQNWYYIDAGQYTPLTYFLLASVSFSTVLPAVLSTRGYLLTFPFFKNGILCLFIYSFQKKCVLFTSLVSQMKELCKFNENIFLRSLFISFLLLFRIMRDILFKKLFLAGIYDPALKPLSMRY